MRVFDNIARALSMIDNAELAVYQFEHGMWTATIRSANDHDSILYGLYAGGSSFSDALYNLEQKAALYPELTD